MTTEKPRYRIRNWAAYNEALVQRGSITLWIDEAICTRWYANERVGKPGAPTLYSDGMIQMGLVVRSVFRFPLRALEGFLRSIVRLLGWEGILVPDYTTFCRRQRRLQVGIPRRLPNQPLHLAVDSTGLKIFGEGEWKRRIHGAGHRRRWRKLHIAVDPDSKQVVAYELTADSISDDQVLPDLLSQLNEEPLASVAGDRAYDTGDCHRAIAAAGAKALIPPRENAVEWAADHPRTAIVRAIREKGGKQESGYHRRSLAENAFFRIKTLFGDRLQNRRFEAQCTEAYCRLVALNCMTTLGMPESMPEAG